MFLIDKIKDTVVDKITDKISDKVDELTEGQIKIESILKGQVKVDGNKYVDKVLESLNSKIRENGLNMIGLPSQDIDFEKDIACGIKLSGQARLADGSISGLASFTRFGETGIDINAFGDPLIKATASIGIQQLAVHYGVNLKVWCVSKEASIDGWLKDVSVDLGLRVGRDFKVSLNQMELKYKGDLELEFKDFASFDFLSDMLTDELQTTIKESVVEYLEKNVKTYIADLLAQLNFSL